MNTLDWTFLYEHGHLEKAVDPVDDLRKGLKEKVRNVAVAGAITAGSMMGAGQAKADMVPHKHLSQSYLKHAFQNEKAGPAMDALNGAGLMPVVHFDKDTGESRLSIHDAKTKKHLGHISDTGDYHFPMQRMQSGHNDALKEHIQTISGHFQNFLKDHANK